MWGPRQRSRKNTRPESRHIISPKEAVRAALTRRVTRTQLRVIEIEIEIEVAVQVTERWILARARNETVFSLGWHDHPCLR